MIRDWLALTSQAGARREQGQGEPLLSRHGLKKKGGPRKEKEKIWAPRGGRPGLFLPCFEVQNTRGRRTEAEEDHKALRKGQGPGSPDPSLNVRAQPLTTKILQPHGACRDAYVLYLEVTESHGSSVLAAAGHSCAPRLSAEKPTCRRPAQDQAGALQHVEGPAGAGSAWLDVPQCLCYSHTCG